MKRKIERLMATLPPSECKSENIAKIVDLPVEMVRMYMLLILSK